MAEPATYVRIAKPAARSVVGAVAIGRSSLWLGPDHLLIIDSNGYTETYKRLYFRDIQAIAIVATRRRTIWNAVLAAPLVICAAFLITELASGAQFDIAPIAIESSIALILGIIMIVNSLRGRACLCEIRTAVQAERVPSICRMKIADRFLERIRPLIAASQGLLAPADVSRRMQAWSEPNTAAAPPAGPSAVAERSTEAPPSETLAARSLAPPQAEAPPPAQAQS